MTACPGSGRRWTQGMGRAICQGCHRSSAALGVTPRLTHTQARRLVKSGAVAPEHERRP